LENLKIRDHLGCLIVDWKIKLKWALVGYMDVDWIQLAQDFIQKWAIVNTVMKIRVPQKVGNFLVS
jgi:hypothetical protein